MPTRRVSFVIGIVFVLIILIGIPLKSQFRARTSGPIADAPVIAGRNVNMVSGTKLPWGDAWLQRQNESSMAVSTRNPMHILAGANDYRTVDMQIPGEEVPGHQIEQAQAARDAWVSVLESLDGGQSWVGTLLPGFPQDADYPNHILREFAAAADPMVRAGTNGLFFYSGMAFNRIERGNGAIFIARYIDHNDREISTGHLLAYPEADLNPIKYIDTKILARGNAGHFLDMPYMTVAIPNSMTGTSVVTTAGGIPESIPNNHIYVVYSDFVGKADVNIRSQINIINSKDNGNTWSKPLKISESQHVIQRPIVKVDPSDRDRVYVVFRRFAHGDISHAIVFVKSEDGGQSFSKPIELTTLTPFDQGTTNVSVRHNSYATMAVDADGIVYVVYTQREGGISGQSRIYMIYSSTNGSTWSSPIGPLFANVDGAQGHQLWPSLTFTAGKLVLGWCDQRDDVSLHHDGWYADSTEAATRHRHTIDVRVAQADPGMPPVFGQSVRVSRYLHVFRLDEATGEPVTQDIGGIEYFETEQVQWNWLNLPMFQDGLVPFHGDWIDVVGSPSFLPDFYNGWQYNTGPGAAAASVQNNVKPRFPVVHFTWTDTRDVRWPPGAGGSPDPFGDWGAYTPFYDTDQSSEYKHLYGNECTDGSNAGMRNQNVYTATISDGLLVGSLGNTKPLNSLGYTDDDPEGGELIPRAFSVFVKNVTDQFRTFELTFEIPTSTEVHASFEQFADLPALTVVVDPFSSISVPVYLKLIPPTDTFRYETVNVLVTEKPALDPLNALFGVVILNPDHTNPPIQETPVLPDDIQELEIFDPYFYPQEEYDIFTYQVSGDWSVNAGFVNPEDINPDTVNPNIRSENQNPNIRSENYVSPNIRSPNIRSPNIRSSSITDVTWTAENQGNTTAAYFFNINSDYEAPSTTEGDPDYVPPSEAVIFQLLAYKVYTTPTVDGNNCVVGEEEHHELVANITNPNIRSPNIRSPNIRSTSQAAMRVQDEVLESATVSLAPGEKVKFILRASDPYPGNGDDFDPGTVEEPKVMAAIASFAVNTTDAQEGNFDPPVATSFDPTGESAVSITTRFLPMAYVDQPYSFTLDAWGTPDYDWEILEGPSWLGINITTGELSGTPSPGDASAGPPYVRVQVTDDSGAQADKQFALLVDLEITRDTLPDITVGAAYSETVTAVGGYAPYTWAFEGAKPDWLSIDPNSGILTAIPDGNDVSVNPYTFTVKVLDSDNPAQTDFQEYSVYVLSGLLPVINGLVAYYPFNGNADDASGNGHHGTVFGDAAFTADRFGFTGRALSFDGVDDYVQLPDETAFDLTDLTILVTLKVPSIAVNNRVMSKGAEFGNYALEILGQTAGDNSGEASYVHQTAGGNWSTGVTNDPVVLNQYMQLAVTLNATTFKSYLNGQPQVTDVPTQPVSNDENVILGKIFFSGSGDQFFSGVIDEVLIYDRVLSDAEIASLCDLPVYTPITTIAGNGTAGYSGDNDDAITAQLDSPHGMAIDNFGNVFVADTGNHRIRRIDAGTGIITTFAGTGTAGYSGDGGQPMNAQLDSPRGIAFDSGNNLYIADTGNHCIRLISPSETQGQWIISTVAGQGTAGTAGNDGAASAASLSYPSALAIDGSDNVFIADEGNHWVRMISAADSNIYLVAGDSDLPIGSGFDPNPYPTGDEGGPAVGANLYNPSGVALDSQGIIYIASFYDCTILKVDGGTINMAAGGGLGNCDYTGDGGPATAAKLREPAGVFLDSAGNLYIADTNNHVIRMVDASSGNISTIAGSGQAGYGGDGGSPTSASLDSPRQVWLDTQGNIYIVDTGNHCIRKIAAQVVI